MSRSNWVVSIDLRRW